jgi:uncharacterized protein with HEPN domain
MSKGREISDYLDDIVTAIADVEEFTHGMCYEMFAADKKTVNAVIRCLHSSTGATPDQTNPVTIGKTRW